MTLTSSTRISTYFPRNLITLISDNVTPTEIGRPTFGFGFCIRKKFLVLAISLYYRTRNSFFMNIVNMDGVLRNFSKLLCVQSPMQQFHRSLVILKRRHQVQLQKKNSKQKPILKGRHFIYDVVDYPELKKQKKMDVILTQYVEGLGHQGEKVSVRPSYAYERLLLPKLAVYASPENIESMKNVYNQNIKKEIPSSITALQTVNYLKNMVVSVSMNKDIPWTIEPWHIRVSLRKMNVHVLDNDSIELPEQPISGPDLTLEGKSFVIYITINKKEKVPVECNLHHWSTKYADRLPHTQFFRRAPVSILPEQTDLLMSLREKKKI